MRFKDGVNPFGIRPELLLGLVVADRVYEGIGIEMVVTSLNDSTHKQASLHYAGAAADLRIWNVTDVERLAQEIRNALGGNPDFDVVVEKDHIHFEYQPKFRGIKA